jgi:uncharacterized protein
MIRRFGFTNFTSFKEGVDISFELDGNTPESISQGRAVSTVLGIKGSNGSGKTNILQALSFLSHFCTTGARKEVTSNDENIQPKIAVDSFFFNSDPICFYIEFNIEEKQYTYETTIQDGNIVKEQLCRTIKSKRTLVERENNTITKCIADFNEFKTFELNENTSILEMTRKFKFKKNIQILHDIYNFFFKIITNVNYYGYHDFKRSISNISKDFLNNPKKLLFTREIIKASDSSISGLEIKKFKDPEGEDTYQPIFMHKLGNSELELSFSKQSSGTQKLYRVLGAYFSVITSGGVLILDEFDIHLHALMLPLLVNLFENKDINKFGAQLIFTAHNTEIIDTLGKYRMILVNKEEGESYAYRLDDIPGNIVRNDRPITPIYLNGRIGGIPPNVDGNLVKALSEICYGRE